MTTLAEAWAEILEESGYSRAIAQQAADACMVFEKGGVAKKLLRLEGIAEITKKRKALIFIFMDRSVLAIAYRAGVREPWKQITAEISNERWVKYEEGLAGDVRFEHVLARMERKMEKGCHPSGG